MSCESAWNKDPVFGVIGIQSGPPGLDDPAQVIKVACKPVHAMNDNRIPRPHKAHQHVQLRALGIFPRGLVGESLVYLNAFQLPRLCLIKGTNADVADALAEHVCSRGKVVFQAFWWDAENQNYPHGWYTYLAKLSPRLRGLGFDGIWFPAPSKSNSGSFSMGYDIFDHYDLGSLITKSTGERHWLVSHASTERLHSSLPS